MNKKIERIKVFIDASNFYYYCKDIGIPTFPKFNFELFINILQKDRKIVDKIYYVGGVRGKKGDRKSIRMMSNQMKLFSFLKKSNWKIEKGYLLKSGDKYVEKGVDVKLALDLALGAVDNLFDTAVLISSDTDLLPAVEQVQNRGKLVEYVGFQHRTSKAMLNNCKEMILLRKDDLLKCLN